MSPKPSQTDSRREAFIVRVWLMPQLNTWVAEVQDVRTGQVVHVRSLEDLPGQLIQHMAAPGQTASSHCPEEDENTTS